MAKLTLDIVEEYEFELIGICSHVKDYRLSWELNTKLALDLVKENNLELNVKQEKQSYSFFSFADDEKLTEFYLIGNRCENGFLLPEEKKSDYFLLIKGALREAEKQHILKDISELKSVLTSYEIEVETLKSKDNLLF